MALRLLDLIPVLDCGDVDDPHDWQVAVGEMTGVERWEFTDADEVEEGTPRYDEYELVGHTTDGGFSRFVGAAVTLVENARSYRNAMELARKLAEVILSLGGPHTGELLGRELTAMDRPGFADIIAALGTLDLTDASASVISSLETFSKLANARLSEAAKDALDLQLFKAEAS